MEHKEPVRKLPDGQNGNLDNSVRYDDTHIQDTNNSYIKFTISYTLDSKTKVMYMFIWTRLELSNQIHKIEVNRCKNLSES